MATLHTQFTDARVPIAQASTGATAASKGWGFVLGKCASLSDVLLRDPNGTTVSHCGTVVTPAGARRAADKSYVAGETIRRTHTGFRHMNITDANLCVNRGVGGARVIVRADQGKGHHASTALSHPYRRVGQIRIGQSEVALLRNTACNTRGRHRWLDDEPLDARLIDATNGKGGVESAPELPVRIDNLL